MKFEDKYEKDVEHAAAASVPGRAVCLYSQQSFQAESGLLPQSLEALIIHDDYDVDQLRDWNARVIKERFEPVVEDLISCKRGFSYPTDSSL